MGPDGIAHRLRHTPIARILQIAGMLIAAAALARVIAAAFAANAAAMADTNAESVGDFVTDFAPQDGAFVVFLDAVGDRGAVVGLVALVVLCSAVVLGHMSTRRARPAYRLSPSACSSSPWQTTCRTSSTGPGVSRSVSPNWRSVSRSCSRVSCWRPSRGDRIRNLNLA